MRASRASSFAPVWGVVALGGLLASGPWTRPRASAQDGASELTQRTTGYIEMPAATDGSYVLASPSGSGHNWGRPEFIRHLVLVAREWHRRHPELPVLCVGDMSHEDASDFPPHKTHKDGLTADIVTRSPNVCHVSYASPDHQVELAQLFVAYGARRIYFNGDAVVAKVKVAQKLEKHDDHFHVEIDPAKVPDEGKPLVVPAGDLATGATLGSSGLDADGKTLLLRWMVLGGAKDKVKTITPIFDDGDDANGALWAPGAQKPGKDNVLKVPTPLEDRTTYRWKLTLELASGDSVGFDWQTFKTDLAPPLVEALGPAEDAAVSTPPELAWSFAKEGAEQASFVVELSDAPSGKKVTHRIGPIAGKEARFLLRATPLRKNQRYHWRIRARDARGNEGLSEWRSWKTTLDWKFVPPAATAARAAVLSDASGKVLAKLKKGDALFVLGESDERVIARTTKGQPVEGLLDRSALAFD